VCANDINGYFGEKILLFARIWGWGTTWITIGYSTTLSVTYSATAAAVAACGAI